MSRRCHPATGRGELHASEHQSQQLPQRLDEFGFSQPRQALEQEMPAGQQAGHHQLEHLLLAEDGGPQSGQQSLGHVPCGLALFGGQQRVRPRRRGYAPVGFGSDSIGSRQRRCELKVRTMKGWGEPRTSRHGEISTWVVCFGTVCHHFGGSPPLFDVRTKRFTDIPTDSRNSGPLARRTQRHDSRTCCHMARSHQDDRLETSPICWVSGHRYFAASAFVPYTATSSNRPTSSKEPTPNRPDVNALSTARMAGLSMSSK